MPPKKNNNSTKNNNSNTKKKGGNKNEDDFDAMLAAAVKDTSATAAKNHQQQNKNGPGNGEEGARKYRSYADKDPVVPSTADHPENPYPQVPEGCQRQTWPEPTIPVQAQYPKHNFPAGAVTPYADDPYSKDPNTALNDGTSRYLSEEKRALERATATELTELREAAEVHRQVRRWAQSWLRPGLPLIYIADKIEKKLEELIGKDGIKRGQAFPTGVSLNHCAAHFTPNGNGDEKVVLDYEDVMKIDFGTQINGRIIDCAWTVAFNEPKYENLLRAVRESTYEGVRQAGIDVRLCDVGAAIEEVMESYEIEINNKVYPIKSIRNLTGHNIAPYVIHGGKSVPIVKGGEQTKMEEGELFAIETFGTTGRGYVAEEGDCSHYMMVPGGETMPLRSERAAALLKHIHTRYSTLAFCRKWLDRGGEDRHLLALNQLCEAGAVNKYPPLCDVKGCYTAQVEHTLLLRPTAKEVLSKGDDY